MVVALIALFVALGGSAAALSGSNTVQTDDLGPGSQVTAPDVAANAVNGSDVVDNSLTGADILESSLTGNTRKLIYNASASNPGPITNIATVGPYTIKARCAVGGLPGIVLVHIYANGPAGTADSMWSVRTNDSTAGSIQSNGTGFPANTNTEIISSFGAGPGDFSRGGGTVMLRTGSTVVQVDFNVVADARSAPGSCFLYGTATRAT
jgi:hypothetical protein